MTSEPLVRPVEPRDRDAVVAIARPLVGSDTYAFDADVTDDELWAYFAPDPPSTGGVAVLDEQVLGAFVIRPVAPGPGDHVANASFAVAAAARGRGLGRSMGARAIEIATAAGYHAMQFNRVVATNLAAVALWRSLGFEIVGTVPDGFRLPDGAFVDHHIMYRRLGAADRSG